jgi:ADP-ribose pyrophosphatase YjhB (NUDIX family)
LTSGDTQERTYPTRPYLAVSAAIFRDGRVLIVRRGRAPSQGIYTLPGGGVEVGETLEAAVVREVREETGLEIELLALAGYRREDRAAFCHSAVRGALARRRDFAQRGTCGSRLAFAVAARGPTYHRRPG